MFRSYLILCSLIIYLGLVSAYAPMRIPSVAVSSTRYNKSYNTAPFRRLKQKQMYDNTRRYSSAEVSQDPPETVTNTLTAPATLPKLLPCGDELDKRIFKLVGPAVINFAMIPIVGIIDTFWVGQMSNALALAGQGAANRVFSTVFWTLSFLPSVVTPFVAKSYAADDKEATQKHVSEAVFLATVVGLTSSMLMVVFANQILGSVLPKGSAAMKYAKPYLVIRALTCMPALQAVVGFSIFRGAMDVLTPLKISIISNLVNIVFDPICIFTLGWGVSGAAAATCLSEVVSFGLFAAALARAKLLRFTKLFKAPSFKDLKPLLLGGLTIQLRSLALEVSYLSLMRKAQSIDPSGAVAAAHAVSMQVWDFGAFMLFAIGVVATVIVPAELAAARKEKNTDIVPEVAGKRAADRVLLWGGIFGLLMGLLQLLGLPFVKKLSPLPNVQQAAFWPTIIGAFLQFLSGIVFVAEGIQQGHQSFVALAISTFLSTGALLVSLELFGKNIIGIWLSFLVMLTGRLIGTLYHHYFRGPFSFKRIKIAKYQFNNQPKDS